MLYIKNHGKKPAELLMDVYDSGDRHRQKKIEAGKAESEEELLIHIQIQVPFTLRNKIWATNTAKLSFLILLSFLLITITHSGIKINENATNFKKKTFENENKDFCTTKNKAQK